MTEDEARTKWCPFARVGSHEGEVVSVNRHFDGTPDATCRCIASDCMAWEGNNEVDVKAGGDCGLKRARP